MTTQLENAETQNTELSPEDVSRIVDWKSKEQRTAEKSQWDFSDENMNFTDTRDPLDQMDQFKVQAFIESHADVSDDRFNFGEDSTGEKVVRMHSPREAYAAVMQQSGLESPTGIEAWDNTTADGYLAEDVVAKIQERVAALSGSDAARKKQLETALTLDAVTKKAQADVESLQQTAETEVITKKRRRFGAGLLSLVRKK